ncbi:MAG: lipoyl(octanoyl) transferase LipB, partial [Terracidiphilus sp.]
ACASSPPPPCASWTPTTSRPRSSQASSTSARKPALASTTSLQSKLKMIQYLYLGRVDYAEALRLQSELVALRTEGRIVNTLLLLEHPPVLTLGRNARRTNILASDDLLDARGVTLHEINRGGDVTYHGPGQLIGYPIFDLRSLRNSAGARLGPVDFVRLIEEALIRLCGEFGVPTGRICGLTGVWAGLPPSSFVGGRCTKTAIDPAEGEKKIAAIGIHVARGVTSHGFAFNVTTDLRDFQLINPCGITDRPVTSLEREVADPKSLPALESIAHRAARQFGLVFNQQILAVENLEALRAQARSAESTNGTAAENPPPEFPANDAPLQVPPEIERLRNPRPRPVSA